MKQGDPRGGEGAASAGGGGTRDQRGTNGPRDEVIARLSADLARLAQAGDVEGARYIHKAIARLLS